MIAKFATSTYWWCPRLSPWKLDVERLNGTTICFYNMSMSTLIPLARSHPVRMRRSSQHTCPGRHKDIMGTLSGIFTSSPAAPRISHQIKHGLTSKLQMPKVCCKMINCLKNTPGKFNISQIHSLKGCIYNLWLLFRSIRTEFRRESSANDSAMHRCQEVENVAKNFWVHGTIGSNLK